MELTRSYTDKDGNKRTAFEVVADAVSFVESKNAATGPSVPSYGAPAPAPVSQPGVSYTSGSIGDFQEIEDDDDLPF